MDVITLEAQTRELGKHGSRAARREGNVPCVLYASHLDPVTFQVSEKSLKPLIYTNETHMVNVNLGSDAYECIVKTIDFHPTSGRPHHVDFLALKRGVEVKLTVPVHYIGTPKGQQEGGLTHYLVTELEISCLPKNIPAQIDVDVHALNVGDVLHVGDLTFTDFTVLASDEVALVHVGKPRLEILEEEEGFEGEEAEEEEAGEEE